MNVVLHGLNAFLLWRLLVFLKIPGAWFCALIFAFHPAHVESVAWITERKNVLSGLFYLLSALCYLRFLGDSLEDKSASIPMDRARWKWYVLGSFCFVCALLSKTIACSLPAAILLVIWWKQGTLRWKHVVPLIPWFIVGLGFGLLTAAVEKKHVGASGNEFEWSLAERCLIAGRAVWHYCATLVWPVNLSFFYAKWDINVDHLLPWLFPLAAILFVLFFVWAAKYWGRGPLVAVLFFGGTLLPALGFINVYPMRYSFVADHFMYLASIGLIVLVGSGLFVAIQTMTSRGTTEKYRPAFGYSIAVVLLLVLAIQAHRQAYAYQSLEHLWRDTLTKNPSSFIARVGLANSLYQKGNQDEAIHQLREAIRLKPNDNYESYLSLANLLNDAGQWNEATTQYHRVIEQNPSCSSAYFGLAQIAQTRGETQSAIQNYERALQLADAETESVRNYFADSNQLDQIHTALGELKARQGNLKIAKMHLDQAVKYNPQNARAQYNLGIICAAQANHLEAVDALSKSLVIAPDSAGTHVQLARSLIALRRNDQAVKNLEEAVRIDPSRQDAVQLLKTLRSAASQPLESP
ncbi:MULTISPECIES: tetratricopeptide repeat protein [Pirellulaceae]|uniref:tetratricopeptide repeat protein n=1 Tax=Pirellulaceae TaxID=2691357 RepID=UPI001304814A|nr:MULTISPECIES: tetratricopeptide repeat protein [Pirellulaceae]